MTIIMCKNIVTIETVNYVTVYGGKRRHVKQLELNYVTSYEVNYVTSYEVNYVTSYEVNYKLSQCSADCVTLHD
jgi:hypothetical protein